MLVFTAIAYENSPAQEGIPIEESLFARIAQGDKEAFCRLYEKTAGGVYAYALSLLRKPEDAEDVTQETYVKIRSAAHLYTPQGKPMAWILTIAKNVCLMRFRQQNHLAAIPFEDVKETPDFSQIADREDRLVLETAFRILTHQECQIIVLHAISGFKHREIGQLLGIPTSTVLSKYNRGIKKLRTQLEEIL